MDYSLRGLLMVLMQKMSIKNVLNCLTLDYLFENFDLNSFKVFVDSFFKLFTNKKLLHLPSLQLF